jgi:uncharacterized protein YndB with AHSA1/START domain
MAAEAPRSLAITRIFEAPPDAVFRAWTDPELARTWWSPRGFTTVSCDMDVHAGGAWRVRMRSPSGRIHDEGGVFREVSAPDRLVFSQVWDDPGGKPGVETTVTVTFEPHGSGATKVRFEQSGFATAAQDVATTVRPGRGRGGARYASRRATLNAASFRRRNPGVHAGS